MVKFKVNQMIKFEWYGDTGYCTIAKIIVSPSGEEPTYRAKLYDPPLDVAVYADIGFMGRFIEFKASDIKLLEENVTEEI